MAENEMRVERARLRITQEQLAKKVGVSRQTIHAVESQKFEPGLNLAQRIARFFGKGTDDVFPRKD